MPPPPESAILGPSQSLRSSTSLYRFVTSAFGSAICRVNWMHESSTSHTAANRMLGNLESVSISRRQRPPVPMQPISSVSLAPKPLAVSKPEPSTSVPTPRASIDFKKCQRSRFGWFMTSFPFFYSKWRIEQRLYDQTFTSCSKVWRGRPFSSTAIWSRWVPAVSASAGTVHFQWWAGAIFSKYGSASSIGAAR